MGLHKDLTGNDLHVNKLHAETHAHGGTDPIPDLGWINVKSYGAIGDGIVDDTAAIQAAVNALIAGNDPISVPRGGTLYFPPGIYRKTATIHIIGGTTIQGAGRDTSIIFDDQSTVDGIDVLPTGATAVYSIAIKDIQMKGNPAATGGMGLNIGYWFAGQGAVMCTIERVDVFGYFYGLGIGNSIGVKFDNVLVQNAASDGIITSGSANVVNFTGVYPSYCGGHGFNITAANYCSFLYTASDSNGGDGYHLANAGRISMISAGAEANHGHSLSVNGGAAAYGGTSLTLISCFFWISVSDSILFTNVKGAVLINCDGSATGATAYGINLVGTCSHLSIMGSRFDAPMGLTSDYTKWICINYAGKRANNIIPNGDFETNVGGWTADGGTFVRTTVSPLVGTGSGLFTSSGSGAADIYMTFPAFIAGHSYLLSARIVSVAAAGRTLHLYALDTTSTGIGDTGSIDCSTEQTISCMVTATDAGSIVGIAFSSNVSGETFKIDAIDCYDLDDAGTLELGVQTSNPNAVLDVVSTTKAFMPPCMTTTQRDAIASPTEGMVIFNTSTHVLNFYYTSWTAV